ncbi:hypothetical protein N2152v2_006245 [Parachlorella kessleri]
MEVSHQYVKLRKQFGRHPHFVDEGAELLIDLRPNEEHAKNWVVKNAVSVAVQAAPEMSEHEANTNAVVHTNKAMNHVEGGWPKEVDYTEAEQVIRFRKKIEKDEDYIKTVLKLGNIAEDVIKQNNAIDIYDEYFADLPAQHLSEPPSTKTLTVLRDPSRVKRGAQAISWHPDGSGRLVVAYSVLEFQRQPDSMPAHSYVWDVSNPNTPEATLAPQIPLVSVNYNLKDQNLIGGGQYNGQFSYFDLRKGASPVDSTPVEHSHRDPVHDFAWTQSKTGTELMSCSTDGSVLWWDLRKMAEPLESLVLKEKGGDAVLGGVTVEYSPQAGPTKFMLGTEQGIILSGNRKAKNPQDRIVASFPGHHGAVYSLVRNPLYPKYFLSIGDWTARIWNEDLKTPIMTTKYHSAYLTGGTWSPTRPGVFFTINSEGLMETWDYYYKQKDPVLTVQVSDRPLTAFAMQASAAPRLCGVGSADSSVTILQLSEGLMFERESSREKNLEKNAKEAKAKARKEAAKTGEPLDRVTDDDLLQLEREFFEATGLAAPPTEQSS